MTSELVAIDVQPFSSEPVDPPNPTTGLTITQVLPPEPRYLLEWDHDGENLHRFEVLFIQPTDITFTSYGIYAAESLHIADIYQLEVVSSPKTIWVIRPLNAAGEVPTP